jgi:hypothetical protein
MTIPSRRALETAKYKEIQKQTCVRVHAPRGDDAPFYRYFIVMSI